MLNQDPWLSMGDLNCILNKCEKLSGKNDTFSTVSRDYKNFLEITKLTEINFDGHPYTWSNNRVGHHRILERLDRGLVNARCPTSFANHFVQRLPGIASEHNPILLTTINRNQPKHRHFKYENMWHFHPGFRECILKAWISSFVNSRDLG